MRVVKGHDVTISMFCTIIHICMSAIRQGKSTQMKKEENEKASIGSSEKATHKIILISWQGF